MQELTFTTDLCNDILAGGQTFLIQANGPDETYCQQDIARAVQKIGDHTISGHPPMATISWDLVNGFRELKDAKEKSRLDKGWKEAYDKKNDPIEALKTLLGGTEGPWGKENAVFIFRDLQEFFNIPAVCRAIRNGKNQRLFNVKQDVYRRPVVVLAGSILKVTDVMKDSFRILPYPLPKEDELREVIAVIERSVKGQMGEIPSEELRDQIAQGLLGLTRSNAENILAFAVRVAKKWVPEKPGDYSLVEIIEDRKANELQKSEILGYTPCFRLSGMEDVGGADLLKDWLGRRKRAFSKKARGLKLPLPKGIILGGPPGTGKSLIGSVTAKFLGLPLFELKYARAYGSLVGQTEERLDRGLQVIDSMGPTVVFIDEAEKLLSGANPKSATTNDVSQRAFGIFNAWMTKPERQAFVICTMNRVEGVPEEFRRKGRFDRIYLVNRPAAPERVDIAKIHLRKQTPSTFTGKEFAKLTKKQWDEFAVATKDFTGAEIADVITEARYAAFIERDDPFAEPSASELLDAVNKTTPQARTSASAGIEDMIAALADAEKISSHDDTETETDQTERSVQV
jgi:ATPase family associated with various cellular activities (AAA)